MTSIPSTIVRLKTGGEFGIYCCFVEDFILYANVLSSHYPRKSHRIGQKNPVTIIKMVTAGTVDEDIYKIQERKARMNDAIMEEEGRDNNQKKKVNETEEMCRLANAAVERFLKSPTRTITLQDS